MASRAAAREVMACELPTATARASTPVRATYSLASPGSVRTPAACALAGAPGLPPTWPSSASSHSPAPWAQTTAARVAATLSSYGRVPASNIAEEKPASAACRSRSMSSTWSRCRATSTAAASASTTAAEVTGRARPRARARLGQAAAGDQQVVEAVKGAAGQLGQLPAVGLDQVGPGGQGRPQLRPGRVEDHRRPGP